LPNIPQTNEHGKEKNIPAREYRRSEFQWSWSSFTLAHSPLQARAGCGPLRFAQFPRPVDQFDELVSASLPRPVTGMAGMPDVRLPIATFSNSARFDATSWRLTGPAVTPG